MKDSEAYLQRILQGARRNLNISLGYIRHDEKTRQVIIEDIEHLIDVKITLHANRRKEGTEDGI